MLSDMRNFLVWAISLVSRVTWGTVLSIIFFAGFIALPAAFAYSAYETLKYEWLKYPSDLSIPDTLPQPSTMLAADGTVIATFYAENRVPVTLNEIPEDMINAVIATEDARYFSHKGVDWRGTVRAFINNATGGARQGGSGITQQYVKNILLLGAETDEERQAAKETTIERKIQEARYATALESKYSKELILENYLNTVYFGDGAYGVGAAASHYFNKPMKDLTLSQMALLAGIINSPTAYDPTRDMEASKERRDHVIDRMLAEKMITPTEAYAAKNEPVILDLNTPANGCVKSPFPGYCQWVREILQNDPIFGETPEERQDFLYKGGLTIRTALDPKVQRTAEKAAVNALSPRGRVATALAVVEPGTGKVLALATNKPFGQKKGQTEIVLAARPAFQNGSTFKPFTAAAALEAGIDPGLVINARSTYIPKDGRNYPEGGFKNAGDGPGGTYDMAGALRKSTNTWFVELQDMVGVKRTARVASRMGLTSLPLDGDRSITEKDAALTLGAWETSPLQVANGYATLAAHGVACNPIGIITITDITNSNIPVPPADCRQVIKESTADTITSMLVGVISSDGTGFRAELPDGRPAAGKTGSTNNYGAAWFAGYTPQYAAAVWVGDPRGPQYGMRQGVSAYGGSQYYSPVYGGTIPALVWKETMSGIHKGKPIERFRPPGGESALGGNFRMPDVLGLKADKAIQALEEAGFSVLVEEEQLPLKPGVSAGTVAKTLPAPGTEMATVGRPVTIVIVPEPTES